MARRKRTYVLRFVYLGLLLFVLFMCWVIFNDVYLGHRDDGRSDNVVIAAQRQAAMGQCFFAVFAIFSVVAMLLIGPVLTSTAIGSEKLRRTFDVLLMTPISAWQIVCGKLWSRMLTVGTLLGLTLPVLAIVRLLGGVEVVDMFGAVALAGATALGSAAIGLWLSCYIQRAWAVILLSYLIQGVLYGLFPLLLVSFNSAFFRPSLARGNEGLWLLQTMFVANPLLTASLLGTGPVMIRMGLGLGWWQPIVAQLALALVLTLLAARVVRRHARRAHGGSTGFVTPMPATPTPPAPMPATVKQDNPSVQLPSTGCPSLPELEYRTPAGLDRPARPARSVSDRPVLWYELRRPLLARRGLRIAAVVVTLGLLALVYWALALIDGLDDRELQIAFAFVGHGLLLMMALVLSATAIANEKESDTWTLLIVTPVRSSALVFGKFVGVLRRMMWPFILVAAHFVIFTIAGVISPWALAIVLWVTATFILPGIVSGLYFSLRCARATTAVVLNLLVPVVLYAVVPLVLVAIQTLTPIRNRLLGRHADLVEYVVYYIPWQYMGAGISQFRSPVDWSRHVWMPDGRVSLEVFLACVLISGAAHLVLTAVGLYALSIRFDRLVGRARH